jgi:hypothetical protein
MEINQETEQVTKVKSLDALARRLLSPCYLAPRRCMAPLLNAELVKRPSQIHAVMPARPLSFCYNKIG